jgi:hypothetical protein
MSDRPIRNVTRIDGLPGGKVRVQCVDEHLRYVNFIVPRSLSHSEAIHATMDALLDSRPPGAPRGS